MTNLPGSVMMVLILIVPSESRLFRRIAHVYHSGSEQEDRPSSRTLRSCEKEGLIPGVGRSQGGYLQYTDEDPAALGLIRCPKNTGMSLRERAELLRAHR